MTHLFSKLGPGLLYAGAAVGVSHIVQSTKAGATYGWAMIIVVILANVLKYPFFEAGPRYAGATHKSLLHGYKQLGNWSLWVFLILTLCTMFIIQAAVTVVTAGLAIELFGLNVQADNVWWISAIILIICSSILKLGKMLILDRLMKAVMLILCLSTLAAFFAAIFIPGNFSETRAVFDFSEPAMLFLISFMGWMPAPMDISVWHSVWTVSSGKTSLKQGLFDFKIGFWGTMILAVFFVGLGVMMLYGSGIKLEQGAAGFAKQLIQVYTGALGEWSYYLIAIAAFTTMLSTTISCLDAYGRILNPTIATIRNKTVVKQESNLLWLIVTSLGATIILKFYMTNMGDLITFITAVSFIAGPIIAFLNYRVIYSVLDDIYRPGRNQKYIALIGLSFMIILACYYITLL